MLYNAAITSVSDFPQNNRANDIFVYNLTMKKISFSIMDELFYFLDSKCWVQYNLLTSQQLS